MKSVRVAMAQLNFTVGNVEKNTEQMLQSLQQARDEGADLVVFSELSILGYPPRDLVDRRALLDHQKRMLHRIAAATDDGLAAVVGVVDDNPTDQGHDLINGAAFCAGGEVVRIVAKQLLPTYDVFDERRYFHPVPGDAVVDWQGHKIGISICEDAWSRVDSREMPSYRRDPIASVIDDGAEVVLNLSASPFSLDKGDFRRRLLAEHCQRHGCPLLFINQVGGHDELIFDGRSLALDSQGEVAARLDEFDADFQVVDIRADGTIEARRQPAIRPTAGSRAAQARDAVVLGIRDYVQKTQFEAVILGLSGGIDSSLSAALATRALGPQKVRGVAMPSGFSSAHSREDARALGANLGIEFDEIPIQSTYEAMLETLTPHFEERQFGVTEENLQARIRGDFLMALSNHTGALVLACGNKSELAVGYTTLYGDMCGALAVIGDLPKMLVYQVAELLNQDAGYDLIPQRVLDKAPSAELRPDQRDEDSLGAYEVLDQILERYIVDHQSIDEILAAGFDEARVRDTVAMVHRSEFKRWQSPPILKVTTKAFGVGWRYPLAAAHPQSQE